MAHTWGTLRDGQLKLQHGRNWTAEDYMDLEPFFPDLTNDEARRTSWFTLTRLDLQPRECIQLQEMRVVDICNHYTRLKKQVPSTWNTAWITAFEQELEYRASRNLYETQRQGRFDHAG